MQLIPFFLGAISVLQATINRQVAKEFGLSQAVFFNTLILLAVSVIALFTVKTWDLPALQMQTGEGRFSNLSWWHLLPGVFGFCLVAGIPLAIQRIGALQVFVGLIAAQMIVSLLWDRFIDGVEINLYRVIGALLSIIAVAFVNLKPS
jgi:transporter family-2 protein